MPRRFNGGIITKTSYAPTSSSASGIWTLDQAMVYSKASKWPSQGLYPFTSATFTPGSASGRYGPTLAQAIAGVSADAGTAWASSTAYFNTTGTQGGIMLWTVPASGNYSIDCCGAQGGYTSYYSASGGFGARIIGTFTLTQGQVLALVVGQQGQSSAASSQTSWGGGGGGGTFVWVNGVTSAPLIAAGGGGCGGTASNGQQHGQTTTSGGAGSNSGGAGGGSAATSTSSGVCGGGGGQGWLGGTSNHCGGSFTWGACYTDPTGYSAYSGSAVGGFGGGGGSYGGGGGGGGYSGGGSAGWSYSGFGGGGGSYNAGTNQTNTSAVQSGNGRIIITRV